jgi:hypothetical protein
MNQRARTMQGTQFSLVCVCYYVFVVFNMFHNTVHEQRDCTALRQNKFRGPWSESELYRLIDRHLWTKFSANFCG